MTPKHIQEIKARLEAATKWVSDFIREIDSQDNRATAKPVLFLLQSKREYVAHPEYHHNTRAGFYHHTFENGAAGSMDEAKERIKNYYGADHSDLDKLFDEIEEHQVGYYWDTEQVFFTESGVKRHLELNGHNYREHRDYVIHAFRNPEIKELFEAIRTIPDIELLLKEREIFVRALEKTDKIGRTKIPCPDHIEGCAVVHEKISGEAMLARQALKEAQEVWCD